MSLDSKSRKTRKIQENRYDLSYFKILLDDTGKLYK